MDKQKTLKESVSFQGVGLHTGHTVNMTIEPAQENHGFVFQRTDLEDQPLVPALLKFVVNSERGTTIGIGDATISVTEHLLAALVGLRIDNALIKLDGPEVPILDGSAGIFFKDIKKVGTIEQNADRLYYVIKDNIYYEDENAYSEMLGVAEPAGEYRITVMVDYNSPVLGTQHASMYKIDDFETEIADCRTFVFMKELEVLAKRNLIKGGDLDNAIVLVEREYSEEEIRSILKHIGKEHLDIKVEGLGVLNTLKLKHQNEPARHKLLDIVGDLALIGRPIKGHILGARPGHYSNVEFAKTLLETFKEQEAKPHFDLTKEPVYNINQISKMLPHRYPFLLVDKIIELEENRIVGVKNVTMNEPFFQGHFPDNPVMPGVLQLEALAQVGGIFSLSKVENPELYSTYFMKIDNVRFKKKVIPGDTLVFSLELLSPLRRGIVHMGGKVYVNGEVVSQADMMAQVIKDKV
ncbi:MAG: UDP-3-O-[3-hydroxymyristoyl] N-acetylglucosamine deacetylase [Patiriisocius sp.]|jgi:UDP-3-O-[3-hydroxymyristoyl] N-acetylglucosamine deacetylase/3-hydroxyacyl-[acyl-carrier-protein] dehydratase